MCHIKFQIFRYLITFDLTFILKEKPFKRKIKDPDLFIYLKSLNTKRKKTNYIYIYIWNNKVFKDRVLICNLSHNKLNFENKIENSFEIRNPVKVYGLKSNGQKQ